jgi:hypothetical protein
LDDFTSLITIETSYRQRSTATCVSQKNWQLLNDLDLESPRRQVLALLALELFRRYTQIRQSTKWTLKKSMKFGQGDSISHVKFASIHQSLARLASLCLIGAYKASFFFTAFKGKTD